jgi:hypothetical protein
MPTEAHDMTNPTFLPAESFADEQWEQQVVPRLPTGWQEQAKELGAFVPVRKLHGASDVLPGVLAYVLGVHSFRQPLHLGQTHRAGRPLGGGLAQTTGQGPSLVGLAAGGTASHWRLHHPPPCWTKGCAASCWSMAPICASTGKDGQISRLHTALDLMAGRFSQVQVTSNHVAEDWSLFEVQEGDLVGSSSAHG